MKISPNFEDRNRIREYVALGKDAAYISQCVQVKVDAVQRTIDWLKAQDEPKQAKAEEAPAEEELSPQQRGAITRKANREAVAAEG
jgi:hypothetical protein